MAKQPVANPRQILTQIVQQIGDLSQALTNDTKDQLGEVNSGNVVSNNSLDEEVQSVFNGCRANARPPASSSETVEQLRTLMSGTLTSAGRYFPLSSVQSSATPTSTTLYNVRTGYSNQRTAIRNRRSSRSGSRSSATVSHRSCRGTVGPFNRDLILLSGPDDRAVPCQGTKVFLQEHGHIINAFQFMKEWNDIEVILQIAEAFEDKIPSGADFEILHSVHTTLVSPMLASGQNLNGSVICRIFRDNKPVYVRPSMQILKEECVKVEQDALVNDADILQDDSLIMPAKDQPGSSLHEEVINNDHNESSAISNASVVVEAINDAINAAVIDGGIIEEDLPQVLFEPQQLEPLEPRDQREILVPRSNILKTLIEEFNDPNIQQNILTFILVGDNGNLEMGRGAGVTHEILSLFWREFSISSSIGAAEKVPSIRHDYQMNHWSSIARVIVFGYRQESYFPIFLSKAFVASWIFGDEAVTKECLFDSFKSYISTDEQETLKKCLDGQTDLADEDLLEMLGSYKCYRQRTQENINVIVEQLAHQELIQKPKYIATAWSNELQVLKSFPEFSEVSRLYAMYEEKKPTSKRVVKLLHAEPSSDAERTCLEHLKRFIKSMNESKLAGFLQFLTGSNIITVSEIKVVFNTSVGLGRSIISHTCASVLEIPSTFQTYSELSEEFSNVLINSLAWSFDIV